MEKLSREAEQFRKNILKDFEILDTAGLKILDVATEALNQIHACQKVVDSDGLVVKGDRGNTKSHPLLATIRDARGQFLQAMRLLKLE